jgi:hypothetical protein
VSDFHSSEFTVFAARLPRHWGAVLADIAAGGLTATRSGEKLMVLRQSFSDASRS